SWHARCRATSVFSILPQRGRGHAGLRTSLVMSHGVCVNPGSDEQAERPPSGRDPARRPAPERLKFARGARDSCCEAESRIKGAGLAPPALFPLGRTSPGHGRTGPTTTEELETWVSQSTPTSRR